MPPKKGKGKKGGDKGGAPEEDAKDRIAIGGGDGTIRKLSFVGTETAGTARANDHLERTRLVLYLSFCNIFNSTPFDPSRHPRCGWRLGGGGR